MEIHLAGRRFVGPFTQTSQLSNRSAIYLAVLLRKGKAHILAAGEARRLRESAACWMPETPVVEPYDVAVFVHYTPSLNEQSRKFLYRRINELLGRKEVLLDEAL